MSTVHRIKQGLDIRLAGRPAKSLGDPAVTSGSLRIPFHEFEGFKLKLLVKDGDLVKRGQALCRDKKNEDFLITSPVAGTVKTVNFGERRVLLSVDIEPSGDEAEVFPSFTADSLLKASSEDVIKLLGKAGLLPLLRRRPFGRFPDPAVKPKSVFVNAMSTAPFRPDAGFIVAPRSAEFQAGLNALSRIARTFLCHADGDTTFASFKNAELHAFSGPHPSGNTSTHIHTLDAISPGDTVWAIPAVNVVLLGEFFLSGKVPSSRYLVAGGAGLKEGARKHYRVRVGQKVSDIIGGQLESGPTRIVLGDALNGRKADADALIGWSETAITVLPDEVKRRLLGWLSPGPGLFSASRSVLSTWLGGTRREWNLHTGINGSHRALVSTGIYDKYVPLNIWVDPLVRACVGKDTAEAVKLGILETDPEDFALCSVVCPSKVDFAEIIRGALQTIEQEGV
jgi:Na+-transporting NADH:ubiquinone oxidoreductase subunit A